jgi:DNA repair exonuclease SbcCD nuclease subunit
MRELVIGDVHFGIKTNSVTWLDTQIEYFKKQIIPAIKTKNINRVIFLGDIFDIRYAVNQQVGIEVKNLIREIANSFSGDIIFIAGNHDYYSPLEEFSEYNAYQLVFGEEFVKCHPNIKIIDKDPVLLEGGTLCLPWYWTENPEHFDEILYRYRFNDEVKEVFCHADLGVWPGGRIASLKGVPVYSGHIHNVTEYEFGNLHNLGSALPLTFSDVNEERYIYIIEDCKVVERITNTTTPMFKRIYNEDIFTLTEVDLNNSYMQICIANSNYNKANYIDQLKYLKTTYTDANIRIHIVDDEESATVNFNGEGFNTNITQYIENNIPEHLNDKYEYIKDKVTTE